MALEATSRLENWYVMQEPYESSTSLEASTAEGYDLAPTILVQIWRLASLKMC